ncbi:MAG TPA: hypothetical protein DFR83_03170, partial [Deltaproteobacteria bacterium]|nr:hypothetical protein [Deltaproteobacteria bacterium]
AVDATCPEPDETPEIGPWADAFSIPATTFEMGCTRPDDLPCYPNEFPVHEVSVGRIHAMSVEVSQELWLAVTGENPATHADCGCSCPVETVTWFDAVAFANQLSDAQGLAQAYEIDGISVDWDTSSSGWRLPTEAEWERLARGEGDPLVAGDVDVTTAAWYRENSPSGPRPVGQKEPTIHGLHDLNGNVWEWVWDWAGPYTDEAQTDPTGPTSGTTRVLRGGSYIDDYRLIRVSVRRELPPSRAIETVGVRLVRGPLGDR